MSVPALCVFVPVTEYVECCPIIGRLSPPCFVIENFLNFSCPFVLHVSYKIGLSYSSMGNASIEVCLDLGFHLLTIFFFFVKNYYYYPEA